MTFLVRTILIWVLVLAVPAQGATAAIMAFCGPSHHDGGAAVHAPQGAPAERGEGARHSDDATANVASAASTVKGVAPKPKKCSACASCCLIGAFSSTVLAVPAPEIAPTVFRAVAPTVDAFAADAPDRPPRIGLA